MPTTTTTTEPQGEVDVCLKLEGVEGESRVRGHEGEIDVLEWKWGMTHQVHRAAEGAQAAKPGRTNFKHLTLTKRCDKASPRLLHACATRKPLTKATLCCRKAGEAALDYLKIRLENVRVDSVQTQVLSDGSVREVFDLAYGKMFVEYHEQLADGSGKPAGDFGWDVEKNLKI